MLIGVTGSNGFIGQHLIESLALNPEVQLKRLDRGKHSLLDISSLKDFVENVDVLYHLAGANRAENSELIKVNSLGTSNLLEAIKRYGKGDEISFIYLSSFQVYSPKKNDEPVNEETLPDPKSVFGFAKRSGEDLLRLSGINGTIVRLSNAYGPLCRPFYNSVISTFCELILSDKEIRVNGDGKQTRDFIFIEDVISALSGFIHHSASGVEIYNLCTGELFSLNDIIDDLKEISPRKIKVNHVNGSAPEGFLRGSNKKIKNYLNWSPVIPFKVGLEKTYRWFEAQP